MNQRINDQIRDTFIGVNSYVIRSTQEGGKMK